MPIYSMIDSHCHLADSAFDGDRKDVLERAKAAGVSTIITIADTMDEAERCVLLSEEHENLFCTVGVHPHHAKDWEEKNLADLRSLATKNPKVRAIGEIGLDYHYDFSPRDQQREVFRTQLQLATERTLPAVVHCREAVEDVWQIIQEVDPPSVVLHCCTEHWSDVERFVERGYFLSFTGIATYPNAEEIRDTIKHCPLSQMMVETDAPYLAPVPYRGKRNEPAFVTEVAKLIATIKGIDVAEVDRSTTENAQRFFRIH